MAVISVEATVNFANIPAGGTGTVDDTDPLVAAYLERGWLIAGAAPAKAAPAPKAAPKAAPPADEE